jgi:hypothetical protein
MHTHDGFGGGNSSEVTLSGFSSGAMAAVQLHVAYSTMFQGVGIIGGGPYLTAVFGTDSIILPQLIHVPTLISLTNDLSKSGVIDNPANMSNSRVWLFGGTLDTVVDQGCVMKLKQYYEQWISPSQMQSVFTVQSEHGFVEDNFVCLRVPQSLGGCNMCSDQSAPLINNCNFDTAGLMLSYLYNDTLEQRTSFDPSRLITLDQTKFIPLTCTEDPVDMGLHYEMKAYVPKACQKKGSGCRVHVALHGCLSRLGYAREAFFQYAGYNYWAEANDIIMLYPQAAFNDANLMGCWDWWGYASPAKGLVYATKQSCQMATIVNAIKAFTDDSQ